MFSTSGGSQHALSLHRQQALISPNSPNQDFESAVQIPSTPQNGALSRIEDLLVLVVDAIAHGDELVIPYQTIRSSQTSQRDGRATDAVKFPGRTIQEVRKFEALFRIIQLSHEALISGNLITKRNIYYQNPDLFRSQNVVDDMVDNLAFTLGLGREDLNIVAAAKGLISGPVDLMLRDGSIQSCDTAGETGMLLPSGGSVQKINFRDARWLLIIEKEATFRTLAASQYCKTSQGGRGILVTAKGFPDLATRRFLSMIHSVKPELKVFALVDFDPHGVAIMRTYKYGSRRLDHEENATIPSLRWLGIRSDDILSAADKDEGYGISLSQSSQDATSQESIAYSFDDSETERPAKRARLSKTNTPSDSVLALTQADRKKAVEILREVAATGEVNVYGLDQRQELQRMLMLNIKAEIQAVDNYGDIADWLDRKLSM